MKRFVTGFVFLLFLMQLVQAGTTGKIAGRIVDAVTKEPLAGANIMLVGTTFGASTDVEGEYYIINIPIGTYTIEVSYIGYATVKYEGIRVILDQTTPVDIELREDIAEGETIVVEADHFRVQKDETTKKITIQAEDIQAMPIQDFSELVAAQAGVVQIESSVQGIAGFEDRGIEEIHVRGGRSGEIGYTIDGMYIVNPFYGGKYTGTELNNFAVEQVVFKTGVFDAEYGGAMSSMINYITKDGGDRIEGNLNVMASNPGRILNPATYFSTDDDAVADLGFEQDVLRDYREISGGFGGPVPFTNKKLKFITTGHNMRSAYRVYEFDDKVYQPGDESTHILNPLDTLAGWRGMGFRHSWDIYSKLTWRINNSMKLASSFWNVENAFRTANLANRWAQYYEQGRNIVTQSSDRQALMFNHQLSKSMFYNLKLSRFYQKMFIGVTENGEESGRYLDPNQYKEWETDIDNAENNPYWWEYQVSGHDRYHHTNYAETYEGFFNLLWQANKHHQIKTGISYRRHEIMIDEVQLPWLRPPYVENYKKRPEEASAYIQDQIEYDYMTIRLGLRMEMLNSRSSFWSDPYDPGNIETGQGFSESDWQARISPRLGFSHVITDNATFTFGYGKFTQTPTYRNKYINTEFDLRTRVPIVGNAGLELEEMTAYEFGVNVGIGDGLVTQVIGWSKEYSNLTSSERVPAFPYSYTIMLNTDYATARGVDIVLRKRSRNTNLIMQYTYSRATANRRDPWEGYRQTHTPRTMPKREILMSYDRTHDLSLSYFYRIPEDAGPAVFGMRPFDNTSLNIMFLAISGFPYTPIVGNVPGETNSERGPWNVTANFYYRKYFDLFGYRLIAGLMVQNLFDWMNPIDIYPETGKADDPGARLNALVDDGLVSQSYFDQPYRYGRRRQINFSLEFAF